MKNIFFLLILLSATTFCSAQIYESREQYNSVKQPTLNAEYKYPAATVEKTLRDKLERMGLKVKNAKGYLIVSNSVISSINIAPMDYAFKAESKSRREKDIAILVMVMNLNNENVVSANSASGKMFLAELNTAVASVHTDNMILEQYDAVAKSQKKSKSLEVEKLNIEKKIRNLQDELIKNTKDIEDQQKEVARQQEILEARKAEKVK